MGKVGKKKRSDEKKKIKQSRKRVNYLRYGPKENHMGKRQKKKKYGIFKPKEVKVGKDRSPMLLSSKGKKCKHKSKNRGKHIPKLPLKPLRKRRHLCSGIIGALRNHRHLDIIQEDK